MGFLTFCLFPLGLPRGTFRATRAIWGCLALCHLSDPCPTSRCCRAPSPAPLIFEGPPCFFARPVHGLGSPVPLRPFPPASRYSSLRCVHSFRGVTVAPSVFVLQVPFLILLCCDLGRGGLPSGVLGRPCLLGTGAVFRSPAMSPVVDVFFAICFCFVLLGDGDLGISFLVRGVKGEAFPRRKGFLASPRVSR